MVKGKIYIQGIENPEIKLVVTPDDGALMKAYTGQVGEAQLELGK